MIKWALTLVNAKQCAVLPHITASVFINDDEYGLHQDYEKWLEELAPSAPTSQYQHNRTGEDACPERSDRNADAHLKREIMGREVVMPVTNGRLDGFALLTRTLGTWERIFYGEFDGQRRKRVLVKIAGE
jgi:secondary thiamine-phosphate synthase enzyme